MIKSFQNIFKVEDLRKKIFWTAFLLVIYRLGGHIPLPGINAVALSKFFQAQQAGILGLFDMFAGGNLGRATVFALGIMPYITASIVFQLLASIVPWLQKLQKEGEEGRRKITQYTRYTTVGLAIFQAFSIGIYLQSQSIEGLALVNNPGFLFMTTTIISLTVGTVFVMWLGERITEVGIGNGISLIIMVGIVASFPMDVARTFMLLKTGVINVFTVVIIVLLMVLITASVVLITQGQRRIPVQYAKRVVGRKVYGGQSTHLPLNVNSAGIIPIIFAQSIMMFPQTIAQFFQNSTSASFLALFSAWMQPGELIYNLIYVVLIVFFAYFYTSVVINPNDLADNMKKYGGFIPGYRPGRKTAEYIDFVVSRITLPGSVFFAFIAVLPMILIQKFNLPFYFGGTSILIVVGVVLDTMRQVEAQLMMRHYEGFLSKGKIRGRR
ncbi:preprotein translocase subunit SecY [candidate division WOR-3 bacterium]|nr:preprotein translocase subunit SecY [candidate division WOR-3 bacterium]